MSKAPARSLFSSFADGLRPLDDLTVSEWADRYRQLTSTESAERGQWRTSRVPYLRAVMDALGPHDPCERVVLMKGTQTGGTESAMNWIGFTVGHDPAPMLVMQPTESMAERFSKQRLAKLIESTPSVRDRIKPSKGRDSGNTIMLKEFPGGVLVLAGANSATSARSMPAKRVALDEVDAYPHDVDAEGDPVDLAVRRASNFPDRKILLISTPTVADQSRIERAYLQGTQEHFFVPCPHCDAYRVLQWKGIVWDEGKPETALYHCETCGTGIANHEKEHMLPRGEWRPTLGDDGKPVGDGRTRSFHLPSLYAPHGLGYSWPELARMWLESKDDPSTLKVFVNTILSETWREGVDGDKPDASPLFARREDYGRPSGPDGLPLVPAEVAVLTAAVDVQHDRLELLVVGWGLGRESWHVHHRVLEIDPTSPQVWEELAECIEVAYPHETLGSMPIRAVCLDTSAYTQDAYRFVERRLGKRPVTWAIKGQSDSERRLPIWPSASTRSKSRSKLKGAPLIRLGVDSAKELIYARLRLVRPDQPRGVPSPGYMHFNLSCTEDYFAQLTAEVQRTKMSRGYKLRYWWKPDSQANEVLDLWGYCLGALEGLTLSLGFRLDRAASKLPPIPVEHPTGDTTTARPKAPTATASPAPSRPVKTKETKSRRKVYDW